MKMATEGAPSAQVKEKKVQPRGNKAIDQHTDRALYLPYLSKQDAYSSTMVAIGIMRRLLHISFINNCNPPTSFSPH